jgi:predicted ATP-dependent endonuclease of OLD family
MNIVHLESITIKNYRKFRYEDNTICFVKPETIASSSQTESVIAPSTTLIIGKNNAGKTTVVNALKLLCHNEQPSASDFNISYLNELFNRYKKAFESNNDTKFEGLETPNLEFTLIIKVDFSDQDLMTHISPFVSIREPDDGYSVSVRIVVKIVLGDDPAFKDNVNNIFRSGEQQSREESFEKFYALLSKESRVNKTDRPLYQIKFLDCNDEVTDKFSLKSLINIKEIKANRHLKEGVLSDVFNKIVAFQFTNDQNSRSNLENSIKDINNKISRNIEIKSDHISNVLAEVESKEKVNINLSGNVTYDAVMRGLIKYNFMDGDDYIPEDQFGLGYINLLNIIGEIIHFVDSYDGESHRSAINILFIEEPEAFMHPQMQEFFIKRIDNAVTKALEIANESSRDAKTLQCQIVITTHSSHIVNSKIHSSNTFNNLNYLTSINKSTKAINLTDADVVSSGDANEQQKNLNFIKKHIKYKVSEIFFSDAIVFVEGITEETLLNYYLEAHPKLRNYYISVFNINGAHGKLYLSLVKKLSVPSLMITDIDIKREKCEKGEKHKDNESCTVCGQLGKEGDNPCVHGSKPVFAQITNLKDRVTTNQTLIGFNQEMRKKSFDEANQLDDIDFFEDDNLYVVFQKEAIHEQYATSLEEAFILTNYQNDIVNDAITETKPEIYNTVLNVDSLKGRKNLIEHSYKLQKKLSDSKSDFSNHLLFGILSAQEDDEIPKLPNYLVSGLDWLVSKLEENDRHSLSQAEVLGDLATDQAAAEGASGVIPNDE